MKAAKLITVLSIFAFLIFGVSTNSFASAQDHEKNLSHEALANQYENIATKQYQDIYAEVKGFLEKAPDEGFADNYDKMLIITEIVKLDDLDGGNDCTNEAGIN